MSLLISFGGIMTLSDCPSEWPLFGRNLNVHFRIIRITIPNQHCAETRRVLFGAALTPLDVFDMHFVICITILLDFVRCNVSSWNVKFKGMALSNHPIRNLTPRNMLNPLYCWSGKFAKTIIWFLEVFFFVVVFWYVTPTSSCYIVTLVLYVQ
jgi:hypothetical protein